MPQLRVYGNRDLPESEGARSDMIKFGLLLVLDHFLERADRLCVGNVDLKDLADVLAVDPAVKVECGSHEALLR
jgi:hypothetical protein